ncbi:MAG TPA: HAMP domain-containing sensor histidine kinase [Candidatus Kapabacteria bacterium]|nr:HAMP domain-containing sensor histidine kinase [Candidatus Kapabacteria bacterium]
MLTKYIIIILVALSCLVTTGLMANDSINAKNLEQTIDKQIDKKEFDKKFVNNVFDLTGYYRNTDPLYGIEYLGKILALPGVQKVDSILPTLYIRLAQIHTELDQYSLATKYMAKATVVLEQNKNDGAYYWSLVGLANILFSNHSYIRAIEYYHKAEVGFQQIHNILQKDRLHAIGVVNENIALSYSNMFQNDSATKYYLRAMQYKEKSGIRIGLKIMYYNYGTYFLQANQLDSAFKYLSKSFHIIPFYNDELGSSLEYERFHVKCMATLSAYFAKVNAKDSSDFYLKSTLELLSQKIPISTQIALLDQIAELQLQQGNKNAALKLAQKAAVMIKDNSNFSNIQENTKLLSDIYFSLGDNVNSLKYRFIYDNIADSLQKLSVNRSLDLEIVSQRLERKISEVRKINENKSEKLNFLLMFVIILVCIVIIVAFFVYFFHKLNVANTQLNDELKANNEEISKVNRAMAESQAEIQQYNYELLLINEELITTNKELEETNNTKNKLFSILAHDLKNAVGGVLNLSKDLNDNYHIFNDEDKIEAINAINQSFQDIFNLLSNLLTWSSAVRNNINLNLETNNLYQVAQNNVNLYYSIAKNKQISFINDIDKNEIFNFDATLMDTVIRNILNNSIKFSSAGKRIYLKSQRDSDFILITIRDEGVGMSKEKANGIFTSKYNKSTLGTNKEKGTGLGLMICYEFVRLHSGHIWFESEINQGTYCFIQLPLTKTSITEEN